MSETIGRILQKKPQTGEEFERKKFYEAVVSGTIGKVSNSVNDVLIDKLDKNIAGNYHRKTKEIRLNEEISDVSFAVHVLVHEDTHKVSEKKFDGVVIIDNDINEGITETIAGKTSKQGPQTYVPEIKKLKKLENKSGENLVKLYQDGNSEKINKVIQFYDTDFAQAA